MAFPEVPRVLYEINPLDEVVCQVKFPPILRIDTLTPASFQDQVRRALPLYEASGAVPLPANLPADLAQRIGQDLSIGGGRVHTFASPDRKWQLRLPVIQ